jgi:Zn-dependent alcohol dehydrogenase
MVGQLGSEALPETGQTLRDAALEELITGRYNLADINQAYTDMREGRNIRGIVDFRRG